MNFFSDISCIQGIQGRSYLNEREIWPSSMLQRLWKTGVTAICFDHSQKDLAWKLLAYYQQECPITDTRLPQYSIFTTYGIVCIVSRQYTYITEWKLSNPAPYMLGLCFYLLTTVDNLSYISWTTTCYATYMDSCFTQHPKDLSLIVHETVKLLVCCPNYVNL